MQSRNTPMGTVSQHMKYSLAYILTSVLSIIVAPLPIRAKMVAPSQIPASRVIKNLTARIAKIPKDAEAEYLLGRTYYSLFCFPDQKDKLYFYGTASDPRFPRFHPGMDEVDPKAKLVSPTSIAHAVQSMKHLKRALNLGGGEPGLYSLTLACAYIAFSPVAAKIEKRASTASYRTKALELFVTSFLASKAKDSKREYGRVPLTWESWISVEAGESIVKLSPNHPMKQAVQSHIEKMNKLPSGPITPLIFSLEKSASLAELLDPFAISHFDLEGTGAKQTYSWVKPSTTFLVWHPDPRVQIRSGRQLFGTATWWLMNRDAYAAMRILDDNSDGWLSGKELLGLGVWQDRNQNGVAERNEVRSVGSAGVVGLRTRATGRVGESLVCSGGLKMKDGRILPTYDWVTQNLE